MEGRLRAHDVRAGMTAGCVAAAANRRTTAVEMYFYIDAVVDAVTTVGSRVLLTPGIIDAPGWSRLGTWEEHATRPRSASTPSGCGQGGERIELGYGPHATPCPRAPPC